MRWTGLVRVAVFGVAAAACNHAAARIPDLESLPERKWDEAAAAHLLRRTGFGGSPEDTARFHQLGLEAAVEALLSPAGEYNPPGPPLDPLVRERPERLQDRGLSEDKRRERQQARQQAERLAHQEIRLWWLERMVESPDPLVEKMTLFWHGHFTSGAREVRRSVFMLEQNETFRQYALGNFRDLLWAVSRDAAMLLYLDNARSNKDKPNENFARELLELFTLGEGNYTEADIKAAARALTGWSVDGDGFQYRGRLHDTGVKTFLGRRGNWDGDDIIDIILEERACSELIARKLLTYFVRPDPSDQLVRGLAVELRRERYRMKPVLRTLFMSRAFYHEDARGTLVKSPVELVVGAARQLGVRIEALEAAERALASLGQELMQPPNVKGWDGGTKWINTATLYQRYNYVGALIHGFDEGQAPRGMVAPRRADEPAPAISMMARSGGQSRAGRHPQAPIDPLPELRQRGLTTAEDIVAFYGKHLLATGLTAAKQAALVEYLEGPDGFALDRDDAAGRVRMMLHLLCSTPEYQMN